MKKTRRIAAFAAAMAMAATMAMPMAMNASAAGKITITKDEEHSNDDGTHTYVAYQIFTGTYTENATTNVETLSNLAWGDGVNSSALLTALQATTEFASCNSLEALGEKLATCTDDSAAAQLFAKIVAENLTTTSKALTDSLADGYYIVMDDDDSPAATPMGTNNNGAKTRYILRVVGKDVTKFAKSDAPTVMKKVQENNKTVTGNATIGSYSDAATTKWNDVADYNIGDKVPFRLYGTMPSTLKDYDHYYYKFTDTLAEQFTLDKSTVEIAVNGGTALTLVKVTDDLYTYTNAASKTTDVWIKATSNGLDIVIEDVKVMASATTDVITVTYKAELNSNAVIGLNGQENKVDLTYSNNPNVEYNPKNNKDNTPDDNDETDDNDTTTPDKPQSENPDNPGTPKEETGKTPEDKVIVFTYEIDIDKTNANVTDSTTKTEFDASKLTGAEFILYRENGTKTEAAIVVSGKLAGWTEGAFNDAKTEFIPDDDTKPASVLSSGTGTTYNTIKVAGLDDGTYYVQEIKAPDGYNKLSTPTTITVNATTANNQAWSGTPSTALTLENAIAKTGDTLGRNAAEIDNGVVWAAVVNKAGSSLPTTGGMGTRLFVLGGGCMAGLAGLYLVSKKRSKDAE